MIAKNLLKIIIGLTAIATYVQADGCKEIEDKLKGNNVECVTNGNFIKLEIHGDLSESDYEYILSIESIRSLKMEVKDNLIGLDKLKNLEELSLGPLTTNSGLEGIGKLTNLKIFDVNLNNKITELPEEIGNLVNLERLDIADNYITSLPKSIENLKKLKQLKIRENNFRGDIPECIFKLTNLESFIADQNGFTNIPNQIKNLKNLTELKIYSNRITEVSPEIGSLENLKSLIISNNLLTKIPKGVENLKNLEILDLSGNKIDDEIPENLNNLSNLKTIYLEENVNLKGKTLSNDKIENCNYDSNYELCKAKDMPCLNYYEFKSCESSSTTDNDISENGECGKGKGKCPSGQCCSKYGYCGTSDKHCKSGCQSEFGTCKTNNEGKISTNGKCGKEDGKCPSGKCCSKYGYCGTSDKHCKSGCQSEFGTCKTNNEDKISTNGKCGKEDGKCPSGKCCSKYGYCGTSDKHCKSGCQRSFGECY